MKEMKKFILSTSIIKGIIFYDESRVSRLIEDFVLHIVGPIREEKPDILFFSTKTDGIWDEKNPLVQIRLSYDYEESQKKSNKARDYQELKTYKSESPDRPGARCPFGYSKLSQDKKDHTLIENDDAPIVQFIFYLYSFGYSDKKIALLLNESNVKSPSLESNWSDSTVRYILNNLWYAGDLVWFSRSSYENSKAKPIEERFLFPNHHKRLISPQLWATTQFLRSKKKNKDRMDSPFVLRDIVLCVKCERKLAVKNMTPAKAKKNYQYYYCKTCKRKINLEELHSYVFDDFTGRWGRELNNQTRTIKGIYSEWKKTIEAKSAENKSNVDKLRYKLSFVKPENEFYEDIKESFTLQIKSVEEERTKLLNVLEQIRVLSEYGEPLELISRFKEDIYKYNNEEKRSIFLIAIKEISIDFIRKNFIEINYRLTPFVEVETTIDKLNNKKDEVSI
ncbi:recombinase family protein [Cytobacillus oceanisediminis]|uniref:recombinase family protein n=1 Tax=Cytobacillus oceanisediminis TaxID=665099 RepID=UPI00203ECA2F|nr:recombinase family protein [Cytobacillus oceanisediminis]MCM3393715.1 recombinase family protein [Cytobacillus oceanisediminis]